VQDESAVRGAAVFPGLYRLITSGRFDTSLLNPIRANGTDECSLTADYSGWRALGCLRFLPGSLWRAPTVAEMAHNLSLGEAPGTRRRPPRAVGYSHILIMCRSIWARAEAMLEVEGTIC